MLAIFLFVIVGSGAAFLLSNDCEDQQIQYYVPNSTCTLNCIFCEETAMKDAPFNEEFKDLKVLIHGLAGSKTATPAKELLAAYFNNYNILVIDYNKVAPVISYTLAVLTAKNVGEHLAKMLKLIYEKHPYMSEATTHLIGFSLGAQVAAFASTSLNEIVGRITGLDPAGPIFNKEADCNRLDPSDANFVDIYHTDVMTFGFLGCAGHLDFYINKGHSQPGCILDDLCSHRKAASFFLDTINKQTTYSVDECDLDKCTSSLTQMVNRLSGKCICVGRGIISTINVGDSATKPTGFCHDVPAYVVKTC